MKVDSATLIPVFSIFHIDRFHVSKEADEEAMKEADEISLLRSSL